MKIREFFPGTQMKIRENSIFLLSSATGRTEKRMFILPFIIFRCDSCFGTCYRPTEIRRMERKKNNKMLNKVKRKVGSMCP